MSDEMNGAEVSELTAAEIKHALQQREWEKQRAEAEARRGVCPQCGGEKRGYDAETDRPCYKCESANRVAQKRKQVPILLKMLSRLESLGEIDSISAEPSDYGDLGFSITIKGERYRLKFETDPR